MTVKDFSKIFNPTSIVGYKEMKGETIAIDASIVIISTSSMQYQTKLANANGEPTQHIRSVFSNIVASVKYGVNTIWCFDSRSRRDNKDSTLAIKNVDNRILLRKKQEQDIKQLNDDIEESIKLVSNLSIEQINEIDPNYYDMLNDKRAELEKIRLRNPNIKTFNKNTEDVMFMLTKLGIPYTHAPPGVEAEELGAYLCKLDKADGVMTTDPDALAFGAKYILKKIPKKSGKYHKYILDKCIEETKTMDNFIKVCVACGTDYNKKIPRVGPKTVIRKILNGTALDEEQTKAVERYKHELTFEPTITLHEVTKTSISELAKWLIDVQGFNSVKVYKDLSVFGYGNTESSYDDH